MATFGELLSGLRKSASEVVGNLRPSSMAGNARAAAGASAASQAQLQAFLEQARQGQLDDAARAAAPGESVRSAIAQLADGSAYRIDTDPTPQPRRRWSSADRPALGAQLEDRAASSLHAELEQSILDAVTPTANADGSFTDNVFAGYNLLDQTAASGSMYEVIDQLAAKHGVANTGDTRQYHQDIVNAIVSQQMADRAAASARLNAEPNDLGDVDRPFDPGRTSGSTQIDDRGRVISGSTTAGRLRGVVRETGVPGPSPNKLAEEPLPEIVTTNGVATPDMPELPIERLVVSQPKTYVTEPVVQVDPTTGQPLLDQYGFEIPATNSPSAGATQEPRLRSETYNPTNAKRSAYRPILGRARFFASRVGDDGAATPDFSRELTVLQRGKGGDDTDRVYILARPDGTYHSVDLTNPDGGRILSEEAVRDLLETQGYVTLAGPNIISPRPGTTDPNFVEASGRRLLETLNTEADLPNQQLLRQTVDALRLLETSGGGDRFAQAMVVAGKGDPDTAQVAMDLMRRQRKAKAAAEIRQQLANRKMDAQEDPDMVAGYLEQHPAFSGDTPDEIDRYATMPGEELLAAASLSSAQSALVDRFVGAFSEGYDLYARAKSMIPDAPPPQSGSIDAFAGSTAGSGAIDLNHSLDPEAGAPGVDWGGVRARFGSQSSTAPTAVAAGAGPGLSVDALSGGSAQVFDGQVPNEPMSSIMMGMAPSPPEPNLSVLDRLRGIFGGTPAGRMAGSGALAFETTPGSWASQVQEPVIAVPQPFRIDVGSPATASATADASGVSSPESAALESRRLSIALGTRSRLTQASGDGTTYSPDEVIEYLERRPEFSGLGTDELERYATTPVEQLQELADQAMALSESFTSTSASGPSGDRTVAVSPDRMSSRVAPLETIANQTTAAQTTLRRASEGVRAAEEQLQLADDYAYSIDMMRQYLDSAADPARNINVYTGKPRTMAPQARILTFRPFTRLPQELKAQILSASRGELDALFDPAQKNYEALKSQQAAGGAKRREISQGLEQAKDDASFARDATQAQREATTVIDVNGMSTELGPTVPSPRATADAEAADQDARRQFAASTGTRSALGVRPAMSADARNAVVRDVLSRADRDLINQKLETETDPKEIARLRKSLSQLGRRPIPIVFRDFDTHEGGVSGSAVDDVRRLQEQLDAATDPAERSRLDAEIQSIVRRSFGDGPRERYNKKAKGVNLLEPSGVNQNRLLRRFLTAESPTDRLAALREMFSERINGNDLSDGLENLRKLAADGRLGSEEDIIYDALIRRMEFAQAQRGAVTQEGGIAEDSALDGSTPEALRQAAADALRDMGRVESGPARVLPKEEQPAPPAPPAGPIRQAIQRVTDALAQAGSYITGLDSSTPDATPAAEPIGANEYFVSTLPTREEIYSATGSELDRILANINTARKNAADHAGVTGTDMSMFESEAEARMGNLARRMQQPDANYTPPVVESGPLGFQASSILGEPEAPAAASSRAPRRPSFTPVEVGESTSLDIPKGFSGSIEIPADQADQLRNWLSGRMDGSGEAESEKFARTVADVGDRAHEMSDEERVAAILRLRGIDPASATDADLSDAQSWSSRLAAMKSSDPKFAEKARIRRQTAVARIAESEQRRLSSESPSSGASPKGPPQISVQNGVDQDGRPSSTIVIKQTYMASQPDGTLKEVTVSKRLSGRRIEAENLSGGGVRLGSPEAGFAAVDFDEAGTPIQVRRASTVRTRDLRGVDQEFEEVPIIGARKKPEARPAGSTQSDDEFYDNAGKGEFDESQVGDGSSHEGESFVEDDVDADGKPQNLHKESVKRAEDKPSKRTEGVKEKQPDDEASRAAADKVRRAKTVRRASGGAALIAAAAGTYGVLGGDDAEVLAGDLGFSGPPQEGSEDTNQGSEAVGNRVRQARQKRYTLMTPMNPVPW